MVQEHNCVVGTDGQTGMGNLIVSFRDFVKVRKNLRKDSEVCHPRCAFKLYGEVNLLKKNTTIKYG